MTDYSNWFRETTGHEPHHWQVELGCAETPRSRLIRIPTGFGKTLGVVGAWAFHRLVRQDDRWPRRLVFCLPMRVLVEQTTDSIKEVLNTAKLGVPVHALMGGVDADAWHLEPESPAVLVGTQDMLLSRALNRGYAAARGRWPMEFALLNQDSLWVMDEVQLMDVGLTTSVQCQFVRDAQPEALSLPKGATWWMSATLQPNWLETPESEKALEQLRRDWSVIREEERKGALFDIKKPLSLVELPLTEDKKLQRFADVVMDAHRGIDVKEHGRITLAVVNTVKAAHALHLALSKNKALKGTETELRLVHSRFRGVERAAWKDEFLNRAACTEGVDRIIVATQVVEAGVDISAGALVTELAPWSSLVQRFGRLARYGGTGTVSVVDRKLAAKQCAPYEEQSLAAAKQALAELQEVGAQSLESFEQVLRESDEARLRELYPYAPLHVLRPDELLDLFDTDPDLTGADVDVSRFIRSGEERDLSVWWWKLDTSQQPEATLQPRRDALCSVPVNNARDWLCTKQNGRLKDNLRAWRWDYLEGRWTVVNSRDLRPGQLVLVDARCGGYSLQSGFTGEAPKKGQSIPTQNLEGVVSRTEWADLSQDTENVGLTDTHSDPYKTIATHGREAAGAVDELAVAFGLPARLSYLLGLAARWHDLGKAFFCFQEAMDRNRRAEHVRERFDLAKAPDTVWRRGRGIFGQRRGFRHELVSTMGLFESLRAIAPDHEALLGPWRELVDAEVLNVERSPVAASHPLGDELAGLSADEFNLVAYLVCSHHGKVRRSWQSSPHDQEYALAHSAEQRVPIRGVCDGDAVESVCLATQDGIQALPAFTTSLDAAAIGLSGRYGLSWQARVDRLRELWGDMPLAMLETLLRVADVRASRLSTEDELLKKDGA